MNNICDFLKVDISDISYTTNFSVESGSHHIVIPKFCMKSSAQKSMWAKFKKQYNYGKEIDSDIFTRKDGSDYQIKQRKDLLTQAILYRWAF